MGQKKTIIQTGAWSPSWGYSLEASASMAKYPTTDTKRTNTTNYHVIVTRDGVNYRQLNSATRNGNDSTTNVSEHIAFATKYPNNTNKAGWVNGVSPKNR
jgi:hypothetical protein